MRAEAEAAPVPDTNDGSQNTHYGQDGGRIPPPMPIIVHPSPP